MRLLLLGFTLIVFSYNAFSQGEAFSEARELNMLPDDPYRIQHPFEIQWGPDNRLWVSSKAGVLSLVTPETGERYILADFSDLIHFTRFFNNQGATTRVAQDGLMGVTFHPELGTGVDKDWVYVAYIYDNDPTASLERKCRIQQYTYIEGFAGPLLSNPVTLIENLPGSNDHNAGRLIFGGDEKLYYSIGDQGANQGSNRCNPVRAQDTPTQNDISTSNWETYQGKVLRMNLDGSIPEDNPIINGVQSHIFSYGHRNPQGLVFERNPSGRIPEGANLYSNEHGHRTDDEVNHILAGQNYGWPNVSGFIDDAGYSYFNWSSSNNCANSSTNACQPPADAVEFIESSFNEPNFQPPLAAFYVDNNPTCSGFLDFSTIAPSSMDYYYHNNAIPGWENSLLVTSLKRGRIYRLPLNESGDAVGGEAIEYFQDFNRYRDMAISPDGLKFFVLTDSLGSTSFAAGDNNQTLNNRGSILEFTYTGEVVSTQSVVEPLNIRIFPNPTTGLVQINWDQKSKIGELFYQLYERTGRLIQTGQLNQPNLNLNLAPSQEGLYLLRISNQLGQVLKTEKIVLKSK